MEEARIGGLVVILVIVVVMVIVVVLSLPSAATTFWMDLSYPNFPYITHVPQHSNPDIMIFT